METQEFKTVDQDDGVDLFDIFFDFSILFIVFGVVVFILAFFGAIGALRENVCLLKTVSKWSGLVLSLKHKKSLDMFIISLNFKVLVSFRLVQDITWYICEMNILSLGLYKLLG